jgi:VanZ family protein
VAERPRTGTLVWTGLAVTWLVLLFVGGTLQPGGVRVSFTVWDKLGHFVGFGVLAALWVVAAASLGARGFTAYRLGVWISSLAGALLELWQYFLPHRSFEVLDWVADTLGAIVAVLAVHVSARLGAKSDAPGSSGENSRVGR